jgi:hypothetical protein
VLGLLEAEVLRADFLVDPKGADGRVELFDL